MDKSILVFLLLTASASCLAQSDLALYDAEDVRLGTILHMEGNVVTAYSPDGYLISTDSRGGMFPKLGSRYQTAECSGTRYYNGTGTGFQITLNGGGFYFFDYEDPGVVLKMERTPPFVLGDEIFANGECWGVEQDICIQMNCGNSSTRYVSGDSVSVAPDTLGMEPNEEGRLVWPTPLKVKVVKSEIVYCNSFENCPIQP